MNSTTDATAGGGVADNQPDDVLPAADSADTSVKSFADSDSESDPPAIHRVDSLTLALEALQSKQAAACLPSTKVDIDFSKAVLDVDRALLKNSSIHRSRKCGGGGSSSGGEDSGGCEDDAPRQQAKRASSLKLVNRQPACPCGPQIKKAVRFADALGLDLALVRHVFDQDSPPDIPPEATQDLVLSESDDESGNNEVDEALHKCGLERPSGHEQEKQPETKLRIYLSPSFAQPGSAPNFNSRIAAQKVVLEKAYYQSATTSVTSGNVRGMVRVANLGFEKSVQVRATFDGWQSSVEVLADYQTGGSIGDSDQFAFSVDLPESLRVGDRVAFCVAYSVNGHTYWDNNFGDNYSFHCVALGGSQYSEHVWMRYV